MTGPRADIPLIQHFRFGQLLHEVRFNIGIRAADGSFPLVPFLLDTGTQFSTISISLANRLGIQFSRDQLVTIRGVTGSGRGYMSPIRFSLPQLPEWQFETLACFTPHVLSVMLLSLSDLVDHFELHTSYQPTEFCPYGALVLTLRG